MLRETTYQDKIEMLRPWLPEIIETVKKDLKKEHLKIDPTFCKRYFMGRNPMQIQAEEMVTAYATDIAEGNVGLGEFIATRWILKNSEIYDFFEEKMVKIEDDFDQLEELSQEQSQPIVEEAIERFGVTATYLFCVFNSVVFPEAIYTKLRQEAERETHQTRQTESVEEETKTVEKLTKRHERELAALTDRFSKKLSGLQKKYLRDTETLKKQLSALQKKVYDTNS